MARKRMKTNLKPINNIPQEKSHIENIERVNSTETEPINNDEEMSLDDYMDLADKDNILNTINSETDIEKYISEIEELKNELHKYKVENLNLRNELERFNCNTNNVTINTENGEKIKKLEEENDDLILRNSELEYENARLNQTIKIFQEEKDNKLHTHTPNGYTPNNQVNKINPLIRPTYRKLNNGYEDWI